jgi:hypothetical protein
MATRRVESILVFKLFKTNSPWALYRGGGGGGGSGSSLREHVSNVNDISDSSSQLRDKTVLAKKSSGQ